jgi:hypothetical protein
VIVSATTERPPTVISSGRLSTERQESADKLFVELKNKNYTCMPLHGGREQIDRDQTIVSICSRPPCKGIHV